jgi:putative two-component system response regulator
MESLKLSKFCTAKAAGDAEGTSLLPSSILVVDDEEAVAAVLARGLAYAGYNVEVAHSGQEALECLAAQSFDVLLTDIHMPRLKGDEMQRIARERDPDLAVLLITATEDVKTAVECMKDGVYDYLTKPFNIANVILRVNRAVERRRLQRENVDYRLHLEQRVAEKSERLRRTMQGSLEALIHALDARDPSTHNHSARVADLASEIAVRLRPGDRAFANRVRIAALFHDIGKIGIPDGILTKNGPLEEDEMALVRRHPVIGAEILAPLLDAETVAMVRGHHEHMEGGGYPDGLAGEAIPFGARIIAVADAYDAMTSVRPYRSEIARREVLTLLLQGADRQWDSDVLDSLFRLAAAGRLGEQIPPMTCVEDTAALAAEINEGAEPSFSPGFSTLTSAAEPALVCAPRHVRPVIYARGELTEDSIPAIRAEFETLLQRGDPNIVLETYDCDSITAECARCLFALDLQARRAGGRLIIQDASREVEASLKATGVGRMLLFEQSQKV